MITFDTKDAKYVEKFLSTWIPENNNLISGLIATDEFENIRFDSTTPEELNNIFMELTRVGFTDSIKKIFQGDHFYRSDATKCPRCWRHRFEITWNQKNGLTHVECCDRCEKAIETQP